MLAELPLDAKTVGNDVLDEKRTTQTLTCDSTNE